MGILDPEINPKVYLTNLLIFCIYNLVFLQKIKNLN